MSKPRARWPQRALLEGGKDDKSRVVYAFRLATARKPTGKEIGVLRDLLDGTADVVPPATRRRPRKLLSVGESPRDRRLDPAELAAWTTVASVDPQSRRDDHQAVSGNSRCDMSIAA